MADKKWGEKSTKERKMDVHLLRILELETKIKHRTGIILHPNAQKWDLQKMQTEKKAVETDQNELDKLKRKIEKENVLK